MAHDDDMVDVGPNDASMLDAGLDDDFEEEVKGNPKPAKLVPWVEKWRPKTLGSVSSQDEVCLTLQSAAASGNLPHLLLYGPPGTGKTTTALALCRTLWPQHLMSNRVLELNASDERGLSVVRNKIKAFANLSVGSPSEEDKRKHPCPPFKLIILDECDSMTTDAQAALRRIIEAHSKITRFILICNYVTRIITPLASRCAKFRFKALGEASMRDRLREICKGEAVTVPEQDLDKLIDTIILTSGGDMRRAVTTLQSTTTFSSNHPTPDDVYQMSGLVQDSIVQPIVDAVIHAADKGAFKDVQHVVQHFMSTGYPANELLKTLSRLILDDDYFPDVAKADISISIGEASKNLIDGADEELQILNVTAAAIRALQKMKNSMQ